MGRSRTVTVTVTEVVAKDTEVTLGISRSSGVPGTILITGKLFIATTINVVPGKSIDILVNGAKVISKITASTGIYSYNYTVGSGSYTFQARFNGDADYNPDYSPVVTGTYAKIDTDVTMDVNPTYGEEPLKVTTSGRLFRPDTSVGLGGKSVELWRNNVKVKTMTTKTTTPGLGAYTFTETLGKGEHNYYVYFAGDGTYEGCEIHDGSMVVEGVPDDEEPPVVGAGPILLILLFLATQE